MRFLLPLALALAFTASAQSPTASPVTRTGVYHGRTIQYQVSGNLAVIGGDIQLGTVEEMESGALAAADDSKLKPHAFTSNTTRWTNATIPYVIDTDLPNQQRVLDAVSYWNSHTQLRLAPRSGEANYVRLTRVTFDAACSSFIGMRGGEQLVQVTDACTTANLIHEFGHAFGMLHEHQRTDRNSYLTVLYQNIDKRYTSDFDDLFTNVTQGPFHDFDSIMHYGPTGFTRNGLDSIETVPPGIPIGQRDHLSPADIDWITRLYNLPVSGTTITTTPLGMRIIVDGQTVTSPQTYQWSPGSTHTLSVEPTQGTDPRYLFALWSDNGALTHTITASADTSVYSAHFVRQHQVAWGVSSGSGAVSVTPVHPDGYYAERTLIQVSETPAPGFQFVRWLGATNYGANLLGVSTTSAPLEVTLVNASYLAQFSTAPVTTITSDPPNRLVTVDGTSGYTPWSFLWTPGSSHTVTLTTPQMSGNNTNRFQFRQWNDGSNSTSRSIVAGSDSTTYTATFQAQHLVTTQTSGTGSVQLSPTSPDGFYDHGATVQATATPGAGYNFAYWIGDLAGGNASQSFVVSDQRLVTASFSTVVFPFRVLNGASYQGNPSFTRTGSVVSPGEIVTIFANSGLGPDTLARGTLDSNGRLATSVAGTRVLFSGTPAPIIYASAKQTSVIVPYSVAGQTSTVVQIERDGRTGSGLSISVGPSAPAFFTANSAGTGQIAALNQDYSVNSPANPARVGSVLQLFATGEGAVTPAVTDGQINNNALPKPNLPVNVSVGKLPAQVVYAGAAPGQVAGLLQVNILLPADLLPGSAVPIQISIGQYTSPPDTTIAVQ